MSALSGVGQRKTKNTMNTQDFEDLCTKANPTKIEGGRYGMKIYFDNGMFVDVTSTVEYDSSYIEFESNIEQEEEEKRFKERQRKDAERRVEFEAKKESIKNMIDPAVWDKIKDTIKILP